MPRDQLSSQSASAVPRVGLVLGAGGTVGFAYHAGVVASLELHLGWDPRQATHVVGTSAGSLVGALQCSGVSVDELAMLARAGPLDEQLITVSGDVTIGLVGSLTVTV